MLFHIVSTIIYYNIKKTMTMALRLKIESAQA